MIPRRNLLSLLPLAALSACTAGSAALTPGWDLTRIGAAIVPVPQAWRRVATSSKLWTELWLAPDGGMRLMAARIDWSSDSATMLEQARGPLRTAATGFQEESLTTVELESGAVRYAERLTTTASGAEEGRLWLLANGEEAVAVALLGPSLEESVIETLDDSLTMDAASGAPALQDGWERQSVGELSLAVPLAWRRLGAVHGSQRWTASWADADGDGAARARLLVAPALEQTTVLDAVARIESDSEAGALPRYSRKRIEEPFSDGIDGARVDFTYGSDTWGGVFWVMVAEGVCAAVLLTFAGPLDEELASQVEESLWLRS